MKIDEWLDFFKSNKAKKLFSLSDINLLTGEKKSTVSVQLSRLVSSDIVDRPVKGWYANPFNPPDDEELAMVIRDPSYLSMEYALSRHGILSQNVVTYTLVTPRLPYTYRSNRKVFEYHQIKRSLFWGYRREGIIQVAEPEKAVLDLIYIRFSRGAETDETALNSLIDDMYTEDLNMDILSSYSEKFDTATRSFVSGIFGDI